MMTAILESIVGRLPGLTVACLLDEDEGELPQLTCLTKGIVYELSLLRKAYYNIILFPSTVSFFFFFFGGGGGGGGGRVEAGFWGDPCLPPPPPPPPPPPQMNPARCHQNMFTKLSLHAW